MKSASFGISNNSSETLDDVLDLTDGQLSGPDDGGAAEPSAAYAGIGIDAADAEGSFVAAEISGAATGKTFSDPPAAAAAEDAVISGGADPISDGAPGPAVSLATLASYLTSGYWTDTGRTSRFYNVDDNGAGANFGTLYYNISGFGGDADGLTAARQTMAREAFKIFQAVLGINFVETTSTATDVDFFFKDNAGGAANSTSVYAGTGGAIDFSTINVDVNWNGGSSAIGDFTFQTFLREIGQALGLGNQGNYDFSGTYGTDALYENDSWALSMMSYFDQVENSSSSTSGYDYAQLIGPMTVDWLALNNLYDGQDYVGRAFGVNRSFRGDTVWGFNTNITVGHSAAYNAIASLAVTNAFTIVDGGGVDTVDFSGFSADQMINLQFAPAGSTIGSVSNVGGLTGNMIIDGGTVIENAVGGSGNDTMRGNNFDNILWGNAGDDVMIAMGGSDTLYGGLGNDTLFAGDGYSVNRNVDWLYGGDGNDEIHTGAESANRVDGGTGDDSVFWAPSSSVQKRWVYGGSGSDTINGGGTSFNNYAQFNLGAGTYDDNGSFSQTTWSRFEHYNNVDGAGSERVYGTSGNNLIQFGSGNNWASGGGGGDTIYGGGGYDNISGGDGNDTLYGGSGGASDILYGGGGNDSLYGDGESDRLYGGDGRDTMYGGDGYDSLYGDGDSDRLYGGDGNESTYGGVGNDTLYGGGGADRFYGGDGNDDLHGDAGADVMFGDAGNDEYFVTDAADRTIEALGGGYDVVRATTASWTLSANIERLIFTDIGNHTGKGNVLDNILNGNAGADKFLIDTGGNDTFSGGSGSDTFDGRASVNGININLITGIHGLDTAGDTFASIEKFFGSNTANDTMIAGAARADFSGFGGNDTLTGGANIDKLNGNAGNDTLSAGAAQDALNGGTGNDTMTGGSDGDTFLYVDFAFGQDTVTDYQDGLDYFKIFSAVATSFADFSIANNGTSNVTISLIADPSNTIHVLGNAASVVNLTAADFLFY